MQIKKYVLPGFLSVAVTIFSLVFCTPAFSEFKRVNECELARTNASVTGQRASIQCPDPADEKFECRVEEAFDACSAMPMEGEATTKEGSLYSANGHEEYAWLQKAQDFISVYNPVYNPLSPISVEAGTYNNGESYITIGLGAQEVGLDEMDILVTLGDEAARAAGQEQILGSLYLAGLRVKTNGSSYVTLYKKEDHMGLGVNVDATIDRVALDTLSWGDADGIGGTTRAGYVGLKNTDIRGITVSGPVGIDVVTNDKGEYSLTKFIHMGIGTQDSQGHPVNNLNVGIASLDTTVAIGDKKNFSGNTGVLGELYMKDLAMNVNGYLDIYNPQDKVAATRLDFGVTIPSLTLNTLSWGDTDGFEGWPGVGGVGLKNLAISNLAIDGRATIDTETVQAGDGITLLPVGTAFVHMGFSSLNVSMDSLKTDVALGNAKDNLNQILGSVYLGGLKTSMNGSINIHTPSPSTQGIVLDLDSKFPLTTINALSWGDEDGFDSYPNAGFVGFSNLSINDMSFKGRVTIDVATADAGSVPSIKELHSSPTFVHIGIGGADILPSSENNLFYLRIGLFQTDLVIDKVNTLSSDSSRTLGYFGVSNIQIKAKGSVNIRAH